MAENRMVTITPNARVKSTLCVPSAQQVPEQFTDYGKSQQLQEVLHPVSSMAETLCNEKGEHRKGNAPKAAHDLVKVRAVFH